MSRRDLLRSGLAAAALVAGVAWDVSRNKGKRDASSDKTKQATATPSILPNPERSIPVEGDMLEE